MEFQELISPQAADALIGKSLRRYPSVTVPLSLCAGKILRAPILADRAQPPFDRVAMDGIAIDSAAYARGLRRFRIEGLQKAGEPRRRLVSSEGCLEAMTGAVLPEGADCVIPVEEIIVADGYATVLENSGGKSTGGKAAEGRNAGGKAGVAARPFRNVHRQGSDCTAGETLVAVGTTLASPHIGAAAAFGFSALEVSLSPSVAVVATGDELVDPDREPAAHQIRKSNPFAIEAALRQRGLDRVSRFHARDDRTRLRRVLQVALGRFDVLILTGGVSMGKTDFVPGVLQELGVRPIFHKIRQKPGKPFWFGMSAGGIPVFALPGNPASVLVCLHRYVLPALQAAMGGGAPPPVLAVLETAMEAPGRFTQFRPVRIQQAADGRRLALEVKTQGSGDFSGWSRSDGFMEISAAEAALAAGSPVPFWPW